MAQERVFDAEAVEEYRQFLLGLLDQLEGQVVPVLATGTLSRAPAFGTAPGAADNAAVQYAEFHAATWRNLQYLRGTLHGMEAALAAAAGTGAEAEDDAAAAFTVIESDAAESTVLTADDPAYGTTVVADGSTATAEVPFSQVATAEEVAPDS
ncbi:hypothetical protein ACFQS3_12855 [Glycomyces mayteni]|uniref:PE family protein n=1 Tax=Glycomyces mayteni TaxID=543887 RepID=A0ABW2D7C9_9ACTN|nr:hypothetical protein GCM10025732_10360 [Glycomyces mayteni]